MTCRLGVAIKVDIIESGFIYTSLLGYFGATAAAGRALGLTPEEMVNAFGIVYSSVAGNHQVTRDASLMKRLQPGLAAQAAVVAVQLAERGIRGAQNVFEGADGFFRVYFRNRVDVDVMRKDLGKRFELLNLSYKPYPCCRDTHAASMRCGAARKTRRPARSSRRRRRHRAGVPDGLCPGARSPGAEDDRRGAIQHSLHRGRLLDRRQLGMRHFSDEAYARRRSRSRQAGATLPTRTSRLDRFVTPAKVIVQFRDGETVETRVFDYPKDIPEM